MENRAFKLKRTAKLIGIGEIAVMSEGNMAVNVIDDYRLSVISCRAARCTVTDMTYCNVALTELVEMVGGENIVDKTCILICGKKSVVVYNDSAGSCPLCCRA